jgi:hypothetical protein
VPNSYAYSVPTYKIIYLSICCLFYIAHAAKAARRYLLVKYGNFRLVGKKELLPKRPEALHMLHIKKKGDWPETNRPSWL